MVWTQHCNKPYGLNGLSTRFIAGVMAIGAVRMFAVEDPL